MRTAIENRRYYLHQKVKAKVVRYNPRRKSIDVPEGTELSPGVVELQKKFNYSVQTCIPL